MKFQGGYGSIKIAMNDNRIAPNVIRFPHMTEEDIIYMSLDADCVRSDDLLMDAVGKYINVTVVGELPDGTIEAFSTENDLDAIDTLDVGIKYLME